MMPIPIGTPILRPPRAKDPTQTIPIPGTSNLWNQYNEFVATTKRTYPKPPYVQNVLNASKEAMRSIRTIDGRKVPSSGVTRYNKMKMGDFEQMRQEKGFDAVAKYVQDMEYERLGGK